MTDSDSKQESKTSNIINEIVKVLNDNFNFSNIDNSLSYAQNFDYAIHKYNELSLISEIIQDQISEHPTEKYNKLGLILNIHDQISKIKFDHVIEKYDKLYLILEIIHEKRKECIKYAYQISTVNNTAQNLNKNE